MVEHQLDKAHGILYLRPKSALEQSDFAKIANTVDPFIKENGKLAGVIVEAKAFPGWESLGAMAAHIRFVRGHHKDIKKIAIVTDSAIGNVGDCLGAHFISAEIKHFPAAELDAAKRWIDGK